jgi:hypothetical protein
MRLKHDGSVAAKTVSHEFWRGAGFRPTQNKKGPPVPAGTATLSLTAISFSETRDEPSDAVRHRCYRRYYSRFGS